ncbi:hypothetical protein [Pandoraea horticolens]|nr:hypothetical protein [Pandoraea horticolens]
MKTASFSLLAPCGAERFSDPLFEMTSGVAGKSGRWVELDGMPDRPSA